MSEQPPSVSAPAPAGNKQGFAIASLVLGILSLCGSGFLYCGGIISIIGIVLGIVLSVIGLLLAIILRVVFRGAIFNNYWQHFLNSRGY